jgi:hypothetical protein
MSCRDYAAKSAIWCFLRYLNRFDDDFFNSANISGMNAEKIIASFENGVLIMRMPKNEKTKTLPKRITIQ